jgi:hypothetical protein
MRTIIRLSIEDRPPFVGQVHRADGTFPELTFASFDIQFGSVSQLRCIAERMLELARELDPLPEDP